MPNNNFPFEILFDLGLADILTNQTLNVSKESVLSLVNDYEDGNWRYELFSSFIWDNIAETALSSQEREALIGNPATLISRASRNLRLIEGTSQGSELSEILLYGILRHHYKALPVVPKIFYKQNNNDFAKGADSVHIVVEGNSIDFTLWFGEAKFFTELDSAHISKVVDSVKESLRAEKIKKENMIITSLSSLDDCVGNKELADKIKYFLSDLSSLDMLRPRLHIPILLLYQCDITKKYNEKTYEYKTDISQFHKDKAIEYYTKQISELSTLPKYSQIHFHLIVFPVPDKSKVVNRFVAIAETMRGDI